MAEPNKIHNPELAEELEELLNRPYNQEEGTECPGCHHTNAFNYELTGSILDDNQGIFVEKKCKVCGSITEEGDGDFHDHYELTEEGIKHKNGDFVAL